MDPKLVHGWIQTDSGAFDLDNRRVRRVCMLEIPLRPFLRIVFVSVGPACDVQSTEVETVLMASLHTTLLQIVLTDCWHEGC